MARPAPDPETVARAWELHVEGRSVRYIAEALGVAPSTAASYVKQGRGAEQYIDLLDRAEERLRSATRLDLMTAWLADDYRQGRGTAREIVPVLVQVEARRARLLGLDAPTRVAVDAGPAPEVDPATVAAVRAVQQRAAAEEKQLLERGSLPNDDHA